MAELYAINGGRLRRSQENLEALRALLDEADPEEFSEVILLHRGDAGAGVATFPEDLSLGTCCDMLNRVKDALAAENVARLREGQDG